MELQQEHQLTMMHKLNQYFMEMWQEILICGYNKVVGLGICTKIIIILLLWY
jgi:hypothetical protein